MQRAVSIAPSAAGVARQPVVSSPATLPQPNTPNVTANNIAEVFSNASTAFARFAEVCRALKAQPNENAASGGDVTEAQRWREDCIELLRSATTRFATDLCAIAEAQRTRQLASLKEEFQRKSYAEAGLVYPDDAAYGNEAGEYGEADGTGYETGYGEAMYAQGAEYAGAEYAETGEAQAQYAVGTDAEAAAAESTQVDETEAASASLTAQMHSVADESALADASGANGAVMDEDALMDSKAHAAASVLANLSSGGEAPSDAAAAHFVGEIEIEKLEARTSDSYQPAEQDAAPQADNAE